MQKKRNSRQKGSKKVQELVSYGDFILPPVNPGPEVNNLCKKIDKFYKKYPQRHKKQKASDLIKGAFYAVRPECRSNNDWMSQAASSLRDILYPLFSNRISKNNLLKIFKKYAIETGKHHHSKTNNKTFITTFNTIDKIYKQLNDLTHHGTELKGFSVEQYKNFSASDFDNLLRDFVIFLRRALDLQQIYIHVIIDLIIQKKRRTDGLKNDLDFVLKVNNDAYQYFFTNVDERWLCWLWNNEFLDAIKKKADDSTQYGYKTPELGYLARMAEKVPEKVVKIIFGIPISRETFNPEVIDRFLHICSILPAQQLRRLTEKILKDEWVPLMGAFNQWGFEFEKMFKILSDAKEYGSMLSLARAVLSVKTKDEINGESGRVFANSPFYFNDLSYTKVFEHLANVDDNHAGQALQLATEAMVGVINLWSKEEGIKEKVFDVYDTFALYEVDFFDLKLGMRHRLSARDDVRELAAVIKTLADRLMGKRCTETEDIKRIYKQYIDPLPDSRSMFRLRLYVLSLCPKVFKDELKNVFFRLFFSGKQYHQIMAVEYLKTLKKGFFVLSEDDKQEYVNKTIEFFSKEREDKKEKKIYIRDGSKIFSMIFSYINDNTDLKKQIEVAGFTPDPNLQPEPSISEMRGGTVVPRGPITQEEFGKLPLEEITKRFRNEWKPEELAKQNTNDDFLNPLNAEGVGEMLRKDIPNRLQDYIDRAELFFERGVLDQHYTYSYIRGIQEVTRNNRAIAVGKNWNGIINLFSAIREIGTKEPFEKEKRERETFDAWLADWRAVHSAMADVLEELLNEKEDSILVDFNKYRDSVFGIIGYLLSYPDPSPEDEQIDTALSKTKNVGSDDYSVTDPFTIAINTVRGRAFQVFVLFVYQDGKQEVKINEDVKKLYKAILEKENTRAIMFLFGHYLPSFYFRDKEWIRGLLPQFFSQESSKKHLYTAAWEGYLANNLYGEMFFDDQIQMLYERGLELSEKDYPKQKHFRDPDDGIATHLALAYMHYLDKFGAESALFIEFWKKGNQKHQASFISFLGRLFISGDNKDANELLIKTPASKDRLRDFWDEMLSRFDQPELFIEFGYWISLDKGIFSPKWLADRTKRTLKKTNSRLEWENGIAKAITKLAQEAPHDTLEIARLYLHEGSVRSDQRTVPFYLDSEWFDALNILYKNPDTQDGTYKLIDDLIRDGGSRFWKLKEIVDN